MFLNEYSKCPFYVPILCIFLDFIYFLCSLGQMPEEQSFLDITPLFGGTNKKVKSGFYCTCLKNSFQKACIPLVEYGISVLKCGKSYCWNLEFR